MRRYAVIALMTAAAALPLLTLRAGSTVHTTHTGGTVRAGVPFIEMDPPPSRAVLVCVSNKSGVVLPPYVVDSP